MSDETDPLKISPSDLEASSDEDDENIHGFVYAHHLDTYRKSKRERLEV